MDEETRWNVLTRANHGGLDGHGAEWSIGASLASMYGPDWGRNFAVCIPGSWIEAFSPTSPGGVR